MNLSSRSLKTGVLCRRPPPEFVSVVALVQWLQVGRTSIRNDGLVVALDRGRNDSDSDVAGFVNVNSVKSIRTTCRLVNDGAKSNNLRMSYASLN